MSNSLIIKSLSYAIEDDELLHDISLEFESGLLHAVLGPNGSGKSTLLKNLSAIWRPTSGTILWNGENIIGMERKAMSRLISLVPQNPQLAFDFLVEDIVAMGRYPHNTHYWTASEMGLIQKALEAVDGWHLRKCPVNRLSQGERQRVYIARALVTESPILLLDEPTASLDIEHQLEIWLLLQQLVDNGKVVIATTHDLSLSERHCHSIAVLNKGKSLGQGTFSSLITQDLLRTVFGVEQMPLAESKHYVLSQS